MLQGRFRVIVLALADFLSATAALSLAVWGYWALGFGHYAQGFGLYLDLWPAGVAFVAINAIFKLYHGNPLYPAAPVSQVEELRRLCASAVLTHLGVIAVLALTRQTTEGYSRAAIVLSGLLVMLFAQPVRNLVRQVLLKTGLGQMPVFLIGGAESARRLNEALATDAYAGFRVARAFADDSRDVVSEACRQGVKILLACQDERIFRCRLESYTTWFTFIEYLPTVETFPIAGAQPVSLDGVGGLEMVNQRRMRAMRLEKSVLDRALSVLAFVAALPLFAVIPLLIRLTSRGPVFYRHARLGKGGEAIRVWKFRSMYADADARLEALLASDPAKRAEWNSKFKLADDPRVTPLGRFLRKTSLDELPQLFNVFSGEMALIGPRPIVTGEVAHYGAAYGIFASVKPGITGLWQASGRSDTDYGRRVALDTYYVLNWSPWLDLWILFRTVGAVLGMRGAR